MTFLNSSPCAVWSNTSRQQERFQAVGKVARCSGRLWIAFVVDATTEASTINECVAMSLGACRAVVRSNGGGPMVRWEGVPPIRSIADVFRLSLIPCCEDATCVGVDISVS